MTKEKDIQQQINDIENQYPDLHFDLQEVKKYGDTNQGLGTWNGYEYIRNK